MSLLGAPIGAEIPQPRRMTRFDHVPRLHELLPNGGWPGVVYAQACIHNVANAAARDQAPARMRPIRGTEYFEIEGPKGSVQMALVGCGTPIAGAAPEAGARLFFTDGEIEKMTGLPVGEFPIWFRAQEEVASGTPKEPVAQGTDRAGQGPQGAERVPARNAPQRK